MALLLAKAKGRWHPNDDVRTQAQIPAESGYTAQLRATFRGTTAIIFQEGAMVQEKYCENGTLCLTFPAGMCS